MADQDLSNQKTLLITDERPVKIGENRVLREEDGKFSKGTCGNPTGRPPGVKSEASRIKLAFFKVFQDLGGAEALAAWVKENKYNKREFFKMVLSILPKEIEIDGDTGSKQFVVVQFGQRNDPAPEVHCGDASVAQGSS